jgi:hypothetical protein
MATGISGDVTRSDAHHSIAQIRVLTVATDHRQQIGIGQRHVTGRRT